MLRRSLKRFAPQRYASNQSTIGCTTNLESTCGLGGEIYGPEHIAIQDTLRKIIEKDINPYVDQWEKENMYPAHQVMKKLGDAGILGVSHPEAYGGLGLGEPK